MTKLFVEQPRLHQACCSNLLCRLMFDVYYDKNLGGHDIVLEIKFAARNKERNETQNKRAQTIYYFPNQSKFPSDMWCRTAIFLLLSSLLIYQSCVRGRSHMMSANKEGVGKPAVLWYFWLGWDGGKASVKFSWRGGRRVFPLLLCWYCNKEISL